MISVCFLLLLLIFVDGSLKPGENETSVDNIIQPRELDAKGKSENETIVGKVVQDGLDKKLDPDAIYFVKESDPLMLTLKIIKLKGSVKQVTGFLRAICHEVDVLPLALLYTTLVPDVPMRSLFFEHMFTPSIKHSSKASYREIKTTDNDLKMSRFGFTVGQKEAARLLIAAKVKRRQQSTCALPTDLLWSPNNGDAMNDETGRFLQAAIEKDENTLKRDLLKGLEVNNNLCGWIALFTTSPLNPQRILNCVDTDIVTGQHFSFLRRLTQEITLAGESLIDEQEKKMETKMMIFLELTRKPPIKNPAMIPFEPDPDADDMVQKFDGLSTPIVMGFFARPEASPMRLQQFLTLLLINASALPEVKVLLSWCFWHDKMELIGAVERAWSLKEMQDGDNGAKMIVIRQRIEGEDIDAIVELSRFITHLYAQHDVSFPVHKKFALEKVVIVHEVDAKVPAGNKKTAKKRRNRKRKRTKSSNSPKKDSPSVSEVKDMPKNNKATVEDRKEEAEQPIDGISASDDTVNVLNIMPDEYLKGYEKGADYMKQNHKDTNRIKDYKNISENLQQRYLNGNKLVKKSKLSDLKDGQYVFTKDLILKRVLIQHKQARLETVGKLWDHNGILTFRMNNTDDPQTICKVLKIKFGIKAVIN